MAQSWCPDCEVWADERSCYFCGQPLALPNKKTPRPRPQNAYNVPADREDPIHVIETVT